MGNDLSRARVLTVSSFLTNFAVQTYGMVTKPNMKDVADKNHYAFSPNPWFIAAFFSGQVVLQLVWIRQLFASDPPNGYQPITQAPPSADAAVEDDSMAWKVALGYAPVYALGNFCIAGWLFFWQRQNFTASQVLVTINSAAQLLAVAALPPVRPDSPTLHKLTHLVAKTFAGIGVLDFIDNGGVASRNTPPPSGAIQALTYIFFPVATAYSGPIFGSVLLYDLAALTVGQMGVRGAEQWPRRLGWTMLATSFIFATKLATHGKQYFGRST